MSNRDLEAGSHHDQQHYDHERHVDGIGNGRLDCQSHNHGRGNTDKGQPLHRSAFQALVQDFGPLWFSFVMNTGIIGILIHQFPEPWRPKAFGVIATVCYVLALVLFIAFSVIFTLRLVRFPRQAWEEITDEPDELALLACWPIAWLTLTSLTALTLPSASWGGAASSHWSAILAYVMWWIALVWVLATLLFVFIVSMRRGLVRDQGPPPAPSLIVPAVGVATLALTGAIVAGDAQGLPDALAIPVVVVGYMLSGVAFFLAQLLISGFWHHWLVRGFPPPAQTTTLFFLVGPTGQVPAALIALSNATKSHGQFESYHHGTFIQDVSTPIISVFSILLGLMILGLGVIFLCLAIYLMLERAVLGQLRWDPSWNSIVFPTGTLCTALLYLAMELDSDAFRAFTAILLVGMICVWVLNAVMTVRGVVRGELLIVREDPRVKRRLEEAGKEK